MSETQLRDSFGRQLRDVRISVTDRCNFRCLYCLPGTDDGEATQRGLILNGIKTVPHLRRSAVLTFEEIERLVRLLVRRGIRKVRLTGGEPLLRRNLDKLVGKISAVDGIKDLAITTNGFLFSEKAAAFKQAGLGRVTFSLDSLDRSNFQRITGRDGLVEVLASIEAAARAGFHGTKINAVIIRGMNDHEINDLTEFAVNRGLALRFIEFMPLDASRAWERDKVVSSKELLATLSRRWQLLPVLSADPSETARRWRVDGSTAEIGIIAPVSEPFCGQCNRLRITADGKIRTCLFSVVEHNVGKVLRSGASDEDLDQFLTDVVWQKEDRHHIGEPEFKQPERTMSCIGG